MNNEQDIINQISLKHFGISPKSFHRIAKGICNDVFDIVLPDKEIIIRLSSDDSFLKGSSHNIPLLKSLGINVPDILAEDYSKKNSPFSYQIQTKIDGQDIGEIIETLNESQLLLIAQEIANIFTKLSTVPTDGKFGDYPPNSGSTETTTWTERMEGRVQKAIKRGESTGILDHELKELLLYTFSNNTDYFSSIPSKLYFSDVSSKNVMIYEGRFNGLVDLDSLSRGDYLEAIGKIQLSWWGTHYGQVYTIAIMDALNLDSESRQKVTMYSLLHAIFWTCENGIQFNLNTSAEVDKNKEAQDKQRIMIIANELYRN